MSEIIIQHSATDNTAIQSDMYFDKMQSLFNGQFYGGNKWTLRTRIQLQWSTDKDAEMQMFGFIASGISLNQKGQVLINDFNHISPQGIYARDMQIFVLWLKQRGWKSINPHPDLVRSNTQMWKHYWITFLVDSQFLDQKYGKRQSGQAFQPEEPE